jgi:DNA mismatch endonuclease (patch repair protein)
MMAGIKGKNTAPELALRLALHASGCRYRLHFRKDYGRPDMVLAKYRAVVFVHGCFWHRDRGCRYATSPSTRSEFWRAKFEANVARDHTVETVLLERGWRVATVWECALRRTEQVAAAVALLTI